MSVSVRFVGSGDSFGSGGRFQTCILVDAPGRRFMIDFGASSLIALAQQRIDPNSIDSILITHLHGDHCGGVPFLLIDAMLDVLFPGSEVMRPRFPLAYVEMEPGRSHPIGDLVVTPHPARHTSQTNPTALRVEIAGKVIAYTGDGEWTDELAMIGHGADLVIAESYYYAKPIKWHLNYPDIRAHLADFGAKRVILTHMGREMLAHVDDVPEECAYDGLVVELG